MSIAVRDAWKDRNNEWQERTSWLRLAMWGELAENAAGSLEKGARVVVRGRLTQRSWETDDGKRSTVEIEVDDIGPSLKRATAEVTKIEREKSGYSEEPM